MILAKGHHSDYQCPFDERLDVIVRDSPEYTKPAFYVAIGHSIIAVLLPDRQCPFKKWLRVGRMAFGNIKPSQFF